MEHFEIPSSKITKIDIPEVHEEIELAFNNNQIQKSVARERQKTLERIS